MFARVCVCARVCMCTRAHMGAQAHSTHLPRAVARKATLLISRLHSPQNDLREDVFALSKFAVAHLQLKKKTKLCFVLLWAGKRKKEKT